MKTARQKKLKRKEQKRLEKEGNKLFKNVKQTAEDVKIISDWFSIDDINRYA